MATSGHTSVVGTAKLVDVETVFPGVIESTQTYTHFCCAAEQLCIHQESKVSKVGPPSKSFIRYFVVRKQNLNSNIIQLSI